MLLAAILYSAVSLALSNRSPALQIASWVIRAAVFVLHVGYERGLRQSSVVATAFRAAVAVALAGAALGAHMLWTLRGLRVPASLWTVAVWASATALTAFVIAFAVASALRPKPAPSDQA
jgi:hypothetical protein